MMKTARTSFFALCFCLLAMVALPVAIAVSCSADRQCLAKITPEGVFIEQLEFEPGHFLPEQTDATLVEGHEEAVGASSTGQGAVVPIDLNRPMAEILAELLRTDPAAKAEWDRDQKLTNDPRITPVGAFLRKTSLDELPQLFNVLKGEMRLVGPRPITLGELDRYGEARWHYLNAMPGMTGLWQVSGRSDTTYEERVELDRDYVEQRSLWSDAVILVKTIAVVLGKGGAR